MASSPTIVVIPTTSLTTSLIVGPTWAPESAFDVFTATSLSGTALPNTTCPGPASPTHGVWLSPENSITLEPLNQTTLDYALECCKGAGIYYFIDPQCSELISGSGMFCQPVGQTLAQLDLCLKNGSKPLAGIGNLYCHGGEGECDGTAPIRSASVIVVSTEITGGATTTSMGGSSVTSSSTSSTTAEPSNSSPVVSRAAAHPVFVLDGGGHTGMSKVVVAFGVVWLVGLFAGAVAL